MFLEGHSTNLMGFVVFGAQHQGMWERALCHYDSQKPNELLSLEWYEAGGLPFFRYTGFLAALEQRWAHIEPLYGIRFGTIPAELV